MKYFIFLAYLIRHKWFVFRECLRLGVPWQGLVHDISKFLPGEFSAYADYYQRLQLGNDENTGLVAEDDSHALAWLVHQKRNRHHWQWWVLYGDRAQPTILPMPDRYIREMVADWRGPGWPRASRILSDGTGPTGTGCCSILLPGTKWSHCSGATRTNTFIAALLIIHPNPNWFLTGRIRCQPDKLKGGRDSYQQPD